MGIGHDFSKLYKKPDTMQTFLTFWSRNFAFKF